MNGLSGQLPPVPSAMTSNAEDALDAQLLAEYSVEVDLVDAQAWNDAVMSFADANIYQTWAYESERSGTAAMSHIVLRRDGEMVAAAQLRLAKLPFLPLGVAYARWGPMWRRVGQAEDLRHLRTMLHVLRREYVQRRGMALRVLPLAFDIDREAVDPILRAAGFQHLAIEGAQRTLLLPIREPIDALRRSLEQKWRNCLNRAEKNGLEIRTGTGDDLFETFAGLYREMHDRKGFDETSDVNEFRRMQPSLPAAAKLRVTLAYQQGKPVAGLVCSAIGDTGIYLYGATGDAGLGTNASYLLQWNTVGWLQTAGLRWYNLHGINPQTNPGTYRFKAGLAGRSGVDTRYLGAYQSVPNALTSALLRGASTAKRFVQAVKRHRPAFAAANSRPVLNTRGTE